MEKRRATFEEKCSRPCVACWGTCDGPRLRGPWGYVCEGCLSFARDEIVSGRGTPETTCCMCGAVERVGGKSPGGPLCLACAERGLATASRVRQDALAETSSSGPGAER